MLSKTRFSVASMSVDIFDAPLDGLILAEAEFASDDAALNFHPPPCSIAEVTNDSRFTGGRLAQAQRRDLLDWLIDYGINPG